MPGDREPDSVNTIQIYKASQTKKEILEQPYYTKQQDATIQKKSIEWRPSKSTKILELHIFVIGDKGKIRVHVGRASRANYGSTESS